MDSPDDALFTAACVRAMRRAHGRTPRAATIDRNARFVTGTGTRRLEWRGRTIVEETRDEFSYAIREIIPAS